MAWYVAAPVAPDLSRDLVTAWTVRTEGRHRLVPDGCVDVLWIDNGTVWVCGPETSAWSFRLPPGTQAVGVRFRPGRASSVFKIAAHELRDRRVALEDVLGSRAHRLLAEQVGYAADEAARLRVMEDHVRRWVAEAPVADAVPAAVVRMLTRDIGTSITALADAVGLGERQLHRRCLTAFGYGAATLRRILRLQGFLELARTAGDVTGLATLAAAAGYTDQPHLSRDCRAIAGISPRALVAEARAGRLTGGPYDQVSRRISSARSASRPLALVSG